MPAFVKTPKDEKRWERAKAAASKQTEPESESYYKLANFIYHKMGKSEEDQKQAKLLKSDLYKAAIGGQFGTLKPLKTGKVGIRTPKSKSMPDAFGKPSLFFKSEDFDTVKHPSVRKLRDFLIGRKGV